jgi:hypothetical protein
MAANDAQMQNFADQRVRRRAETLRDLLNSLADDKASIDEIYARAVSNNAWADARTDGPPTLLQSGNSANPDHMLAFNTFASQLLWLLRNEGEAPSGTLADFASAVRGNWAVVIDACVRPTGD